MAFITSIWKMEKTQPPILGKKMADGKLGFCAKEV
jgi:hypothetical protein